MMEVQRQKAMQALTMARQRLQRASLASEAFHFASQVDLGSSERITSNAESAASESVESAFTSAVEELARKDSLSEAELARLELQQLKDQRLVSSSNAIDSLSSVFNTHGQSKVSAAEELEVMSVAAATFTRPALADLEALPHAMLGVTAHYGDVLYDPAQDEELQKESAISALQTVRDKGRTHVAFVIDGNNCIFKPDFIVQGGYGARRIMFLLRKMIEDEHDKHMDVQLHIFADFGGMYRVLKQTSTCAIPTFRHFVQGISHAGALNTFTDMGGRGQAAEMKVKAKVAECAHDLDCKQVHLGGMGNGSYQQELAELVKLNMMHKVSLLSTPSSDSSVEYMQAYDQRCVPWSDHVFLDTEGLSALKEKGKEEERQEEREGVFATQSDVQYGAEPYSERRGDGFKYATLPRYRTSFTSNEPCHRYNLQPEGCPRRNCPFSHEDLAQKDWEALRDKTKKIPCPDLKFKGKCSRGSTCAFSHSFRPRQKR